MDWDHFILFMIGMAISIGEADSATRTKVWHGNTNFQNPHNWRPPHIPCANSRVIFDSAHDLMVMLSPTQTTITELILPYNGAIIFPNNGALMFKPMNSIINNCKNEDVFYVGTTLSAWMNPLSWGQEGENSNAMMNSPVPHAEQIPCEHDKVVFPSRNTFRVILPRVSTAVGSLNIDGQVLGTEAWRILAESDIGRMQFIGDPYVMTVLGDDGADHPCRNPAGCYCGNGGSMSMQRVCSYAGGSKCDIPACLQPVHPIGHCCDICGATIQFEYIPHTFKMSALENHVRRFTSSAVLGHVGRISAITNQVQIVFVDSGAYEGKSVESARRLLRVLKNDMSLGVGDIKFQASGPALDLSEMYISHSPEKIVGFIFGGIALLVIAFLLFLAYKDTRFTRSEAPSFVFSRFDNMSSRREGPLIRVWGEVVGEEAHEENQSDKPKEESWVTMESVMAPSKPQAFDNPMYNKPLKGDGTKKKEAKTHSGASKEGKHGGSSSITTMENPVYSALKASEESEKKSKSDGEEKREPPPPPITKRKARSKAPKKGKAKREILSEEDTDDSAGSEKNLTTVEDLD